MTGICDPENEPYSFDLQSDFTRPMSLKGSQLIRPSSLPDLDPTQKSKITEAIGTWAFSAHEFSDDELVHSAFLMLRHALSMPELEEWRLSTGIFQS